MSEINVTVIKGRGNTKSLKTEWSWKIPQFAVITGMNGSGKTHLLEYLFERVEDSEVVGGINYKRDQVANIPYDWMPRVNAPTRDLEDQIRNQFQEIQNLPLENRTNNRWFSAIYEVAKKLEKDVQELTREEIENHIRYDFDYKLESMDMIRKSFLSYQRNRRKRLDNASNNKDQKEFIKISEEKKPWDVINEIFYAEDFCYEMNEPDGDNNNPEIIFVHRENKERRNISELSSGEKMIVSLVMWAHNPNTGNRVKLMLLDEPDAHLHPSMSSMMINIIQNTLVKEYGIRVIMTTHSPSSVVHAVNQGVDVFWMKEGRMIDGKKPNEIIDDLSDGLVKVSDFVGDLRELISESSPNILFTEGKSDVMHIENAIRAFDKKDEFKKIKIFACTSATTMPAYIDYFTILLTAPIQNKKRVALLDNDVTGQQILSKIKETKPDVEYLLIGEQDGQFIEKILVLNRQCIPQSLNQTASNLENNIKKPSHRAKMRLAEEIGKLSKPEQQEIYKNFSEILEKILIKFSPIKA